MSTYSQEEQNEAYKKFVKVKISIIVQILNMIEISTQRGAYHPNELTSIGNIFELLSKGVEQIMKETRLEMKKKGKIVNTESDDLIRLREQNEELAKRLQMLERENALKESMMKESMMISEQPIDSIEQRPIEQPVMQRSIEQPVMQNSMTYQPLNATPPPQTLPPQLQAMDTRVSKGQLF